MKLIDNKTKFFILISYLNSCQIECSDFSIFNADAGNLGFSLKRIKAGKANAIMAIVFTNMKSLTSPTSASFFTKTGPIPNPRIPPMIKAKDCAEIATVRYSGGNQILLKAIVAIYTIALVDAIIIFPMKTQIKSPVSMKIHLKTAPNI
jgi:hypothetical protein